MGSTSQLSGKQPGRIGFLIDNMGQGHQDPALLGIRLIQRQRLNRLATESKVDIGAGQRFDSTFGIGIEFGGQAADPFGNLNWKIARVAPMFQIDQCIIKAGAGFGGPQFRRFPQSLAAVHAGLRGNAGSAFCGRRDLERSEGRRRAAGVIRGGSGGDPGHVQVVGGCCLRMRLHRLWRCGGHVQHPLRCGAGKTLDNRLFCRRNPGTGGTVPRRFLHRTIGFFGLGPDQMHCGWTRQGERQWQNRNRRFDLRGRGHVRQVQGLLIQRIHRGRTIDDVDHHPVRLPQERLYMAFTGQFDPQPPRRCSGQQGCNTGALNFLECGGKVEAIGRGTGFNVIARPLPPDSPIPPDRYRQHQPGKSGVVAAADADHLCRGPLSEKAQQNDEQAHHAASFVALSASSSSVNDGRL